MLYLASKLSINFSFVLSNYLDYFDYYGQFQQASAEDGALWLGGPLFHLAAWWIELIAPTSYLYFEPTTCWFVEHYSNYFKSSTIVVWNIAANSIVIAASVIASITAIKRFHSNLQLR